MEVFVPSLAMAALVMKVIDFLKYVTNKDMNGVLTQLVVWVSGVAVVCLFAQTNWAGQIKVDGLTLAQLNFWSQLAIGLTLGSTASVARDSLGAIDSSVRTKTTKLFEPNATPNTEV